MSAARAVSICSLHGHFSYVGFQPSRAVPMPSKAWYGLSRSTTSNWRLSIRLFSLLPNNTSTQTVPMGAQETPELKKWLNQYFGHNFNLKIDICLIPSVIILYDKFLAIGFFFCNFVKVILFVDLAIFLFILAINVLRNILPPKQSNFLPQKILIIKF